MLEYQYQYDDIGNRETSSERGTNSVYAANNLNQYTSISNSAASALSAGEFIPHFDDDMRPRQRRRVARRSEATEPRSGRKRPRNQTLIKTSTGIWSVTYNGENRPVRWANGDMAITMSYDRMGRRVAKNGQGFVYFGFLQIADNCSNAYVWEPVDLMSARPVSWSAGDTVVYYVHDGNKDVSEILLSNGVLQTHYEYAPFGNSTLNVGFSAVNNPWQFSCEYRECDISAIYYNFRHYDPDAGMWTSRDPSGGRQDKHVYSFLFNCVGVKLIFLDCAQLLKMLF